MVYQKDTRLDYVFTALADPTRRAIVARLARGELAVSELAEPFAMTLPGVGKHLTVLERAGLVERRREGRVRRCRLHAAAMQEAAQWLEPYRMFWEHQFDRLAEYLGEQSKEEEPWQPRDSPATSRSASPEPSARPRKGSSRRGRRRKS